jgi:hypothetical protein
LAAPLAPSDSWPIGSILLLIVAGVLYALMLVPLLDLAANPLPMSGEGRYSAAWSGLFALLFGGLVWIILGILLWLGAMPRWAGPVIGALHILAGLAGGFAIERIAKAPGGWLMLVPILLPPLIALFALWARLPTLHKALPPDPTSAVMIGAIALVIVAFVPLAAFDGQRGPTPEQEAAAKEVQDQQRQEKEAELAALDEDSALEAYLNLITYSGLDADGKERARTAARRVKSRQSDAIMLLNGSKIDRLEAMWQLDIAATPALCTAYGWALQRYATQGMRLDYTIDALERQLPNVKWLIGQGCDLAPALTSVGATLQQAGGGGRAKPFLATLAALQREH